MREMFVSLLLVSVLSANPYPWYSEVINEFQIAPLDSQRVEFRYIATPSWDPTPPCTFDLSGCRIITAAGTSYVDTTLFLHGDNRVVIDPSMLDGDFNLPESTGFIQTDHLFDYLIWNPDLTPAPGQMMDSIMSYDGRYTGNVSSALPLHLDAYDVIFVCLGVYPNNNVILNNSAEASALVDYLTGGGNMYMEGGDVWYYDPSIGGHDFGPLFGIEATVDGTGDMGPVIGQTDAFTAGMNFNYGGENNWMDHISPSGGGFLIFRDANNNYDCGVIHDAGTYKTVGTSFELGLLVDGTGCSTRATLLDSIMRFFGQQPFAGLPFHDIVTYPSPQPRPPDYCSASAFHLFYLDLNMGYWVVQDWYVDSTPTFGEPNDDYPGCGVSGHVFDDQGLPISGARVTATNPDTTGYLPIPVPPYYNCCTTFTATDGSFVIDSLLPWSFTIDAFASGFIPDTTAVSNLRALFPVTNVDFYLQTDVGIVETGQERSGEIVGIFPNPIKNKMTIVLEKPILYIDVFDAAGRRCLRVENRKLDSIIQVDCSALAAGVYFIPSANRKFKIVVSR